jgi:hypothetical protein
MNTEKEHNTFAFSEILLHPEKFDQSETEKKFYFLTVNDVHGPLFRNHHRYFFVKYRLVQHRQVLPASQGEEE